jgi:hypothetical protein
VVDQQKKAEELIELANRCATDPRTFHRWHYGALESLSEIEFADLSNGPKNAGVSHKAASFKPAAFHLIRNALTGESFPWIGIELVPVRVPWEVFAFRPFGGWNGAPYAQEQLAMQRYWHELYGAELVTRDVDSYEMYVPRPPQSRTQAMQLIREATGFGEETLFSGAQDAEEMITRALNSNYWVFWWD